MTTDNSRLDRIEEKIDRLSEAMIAMARAEEKLIALESKYSAQYDRMNKFSEKLDTVEKAVNDNARVVQTISRLFWVVTTVAVGAAIRMAWM